jgi:hypothetical protein
MGEEKSPIRFLKRRGIINFSAQHVVAEYLDCRETLETFADRGKGDPDKQRIIDQCRLKLDEIREALMPSLWWKGRKVFIAWRLIHRMGEDFVLLMNCEELAAQGCKILHDLRTSPLPDVVRLDWISKVDERQKKLEEALKQPAPCIDRGTAHLYKTVTNIINDGVDDRFWDIWSHRFLIFLYAMLLALSALWLLTRFAGPGGFSLSVPGVLLLGAMGGVASGIMSMDQEYMAKGHFWLPLLSFPAVRIIQGALAAIIVFWMLQCHYLIRIDPPLERYNKAFICMTSPVWRDPVFLRNSPMAKSSHVRFSGYSSAKKDPILDLKAPPGKQIYLYLLVLFFAGFTGDKILKFMSDRVTSRLFSEAEKTKEGKK